MKNYAACEYWMDHSLHPVLHENLFESENALLTVPRAFGSLSGNPTTLQLKIMEEAKGYSSTHGKGFDNMILIDERTGKHNWVISSFIPGKRPTKKI